MGELSRESNPCPRRPVKTSIIIPVYNTADYLEACLDSVFAQTQDDFEVICVDDGSTDESLEILETYASQHANMTVMRQVHAMQGAARNRGISAAHGEYLYFLDSDDAMKPELLEHCYTVCKELDLDFVTFDAESSWEPPLTPHDRSMPDRRNRVAGGIVKTGRHFWNRHFMFGCVYNPVLHYLKRSFVLEHALFFREGIYYEDNDWAARAYLAAQRMAYLPELLYRRLYRAGSVTASEPGAVTVDSLFEEFEAALDIIDEQEDDEGNCIGMDVVGIVDYHLGCLQTTRPTPALVDSFERNLRGLLRDLRSRNRTSAARFQQVMLAKRIKGYPAVDSEPIRSALAEIATFEEPLAKEVLPHSELVRPSMCFEHQEVSKVHDSPREHAVLDDREASRPVPARVVLWGAGTIYRRHIDTLLDMRDAGQIELIATVDNNRTLGTSLDGIPLMGPAGLSDLDFDFLMVMNASKTHEIISQATEFCRVPRGKIRTYKLLTVPGMNLSRYKQLCESNVSIVSDSCWGSIVCDTLQIEHLSPFESTMFASTGDFLKVLRDLPSYLAIDEPVYRGRHIDSRGLRYFSYEFGDVEIRFFHAKYPDVALGRWFERRKLVNEDNLFATMHTQSHEDEGAFEEVSGYRGKACFVPYASGLPHSLRIPVLDGHIMFVDSVDAVARGEHQTAPLDLVSLLLGKTPACCFGDENTL